MSYLTLENLNYSAGKNKILKNIDFNVEKGEIFSILGPSGAGKSTTLRIITGALYPESGKIILDEKVINNVPLEKRKIVMVHQSKQLFPHMTVIENVKFGLEVNKFDSHYIKKRSEELLDFFNMSSHCKKYPHELSGGQQQLVALMRALAIDPKLLLLDEPFTGLDNNLKKYIRDFIVKINKNFDTTIIMVTHDKEDAFFMSDRIAFMFDGEVILTSDIHNLVNSTGINRIDKFLGKIKILDSGKVIFCDKIIEIKD